MKRTRTLFTLPGALLAALLWGIVLALGTPAGEEIVNQASVTYLDSAGESQVTNSNQVFTIVTQVYGVSITPDGTVGAPGQFQDATPGSTVYYPYTLTNTGNGTDTFDLGTVVDGTSTFTPGSVVYYLDGNGNGLVDVGEPAITQVADLAADASVALIMAYQVPDTADAGQVAIATPTGTSVGGGAGVFDDNNYHQTTVVQDAVVLATKSASVAQAIPGDTITYTISATNTGTVDATDVVVTDVLPAGVTLSSASTVPVGNEDITGDPSITATFATVAPGQTVQLTLTVTVDAGTAPGDIDNTASVVYDGDDVTGQEVVTNTTTTTVLATYQVYAGPNGDPLDGFPGDVAGDLSYTTGEGLTVDSVDGSDLQTVASAAAGSTVSFVNTVLNDGTGVDTLELTLDTSALAYLGDGGSIQLLRLDGTPLGSSDGDGIPDTGPLAVGDTFSFIVRMLLPPGYVEPDPATTEHTVVVTATSNADGTQSDPTTNTLLDVIAPGVAFGNNTTLPYDDDGTVDSLVAESQTTDPGTTVTFDMDVVNTGANNDSFDLDGSVDFTLTGGTVVSVPVSYYPSSADADGDGVLSAAERAAATPISNTGTLGSDEEVSVLAVAEVPADAIPQTSAIGQTVTSPISGATDSYDLNEVTVDAVTSFSFTPNRNGTSASPGTVIYQHTVTNDGTVDISDFDLSATPTGSIAGWTYLFSYDGVTYYPAGTFPAPAAPLEPGETTSLFVNINIPAGTAQGATNVLTIEGTATFDDGVTGFGTATASVTDTTVVVGGELRVLKEWSLDGPLAPETAWYRGDGTDGTTPPEVAPGESISYRLTLTNVGTAPLTDVDVFDTVPTFTDYVIASESGATATCSDDGGATFAACPTTTAGDPDPVVDVLLFAVGDLDPGDTTTVFFDVQVE